MTPPQVARHRRALRARRPAPPTKARRDADTCCTAAVRLACIALIVAGIVGLKVLSPR